MVRKNPTTSIARSGRSAVYLWFWDNHDDLIANSRGRWNWIKVTEELTTLGLVDARGILLQPENVRKTWSRVTADKKALVVTVPTRTPLPAPVDRSKIGTRVFSVSSPKKD